MFRNRDLHILDNAGQRKLQWHVRIVVNIFLLDDMI